MTPPPSPRIADAIVVLGARVLPGGIPSAAFLARIELGVSLFQAGAAPWLLFTGGAVGDPIPEAELGRSLAVAAGVPGTAILVETASRTTSENARLSAPLLRARGVRRVALVTDPFHLFRASRLFWREGIDVLPAPTDLSLRGLRWRDRAYWAAREVVSVVRDPLLLLARPPQIK